MIFDAFNDFLLLLVYPRLQLPKHGP